MIESLQPDEREPGQSCDDNMCPEPLTCRFVTLRFKLPLVPDPFCFVIEMWGIRLRTTNTTWGGSGLLQDRP